MNKINYMVVDYILSDGNGLELYNFTKSLFPKIKYIIISGYMDEKLKEHKDYNRQFLFLKKPFKTTSVVNLIKFLQESFKFN